ncbi:YqzE family protein [Fictibacillus phosphorivorans]|uniref:YqzE family protein n=1 Tax=Fictibacillus phosphorivorans TaxID=1221500 RepID=UPI00203B43BF|nr:YqzE family protein [Fictibacillus phosphorivorans]MCM3716787.1 YqzE family protein [Fictibacillus phosphorivorans]MCM3774664.1 YqzE family protein [Fictibacillus phosphorivorans]
MASGNDVVKYLTQKIVKYLDEPKSVRKERRQTRKSEKEPLLTYLFGALPMSLGLMFKKKRKR